MAYEEFEKGGKKFFRYGTWEIEADMARKMRTVQPMVEGGEGTPAGDPYEEEDANATESELARIARERSIDAASAQSLGLSTGSQSGFLGGTRRIGKSINTGGGFAGSRMLTQGNNAARLLGGSA